MDSFSAASLFFCCHMFLHVKEYLFLVSVWIPPIDSVSRAISPLHRLISASLLLSVA